MSAVTAGGIDCSIEGVSTQCHTVQEKLYLVIQKGNGCPPSHHFERRDEAMVEIGFNLGGSIQCEVRQGAGACQTLKVRPGQAHIGFYPDCSGILEYSGDQPVRWVGIFVPACMFRMFFDRPLDDLGSRGTDLGRKCLVYKIVSSITADMKVALHQILMCPFMGKTKGLFLESKVLELISHVRFSVDRSPECSRSSAVNLTADGNEKMWQAKSFLDENLESPPSILELARHVGVNEFLLKNGFRQVHGITPHRYVAEQRLERARLFLWKRQMNVTEAAFAVGYSSLSHFAKIFRARFGVNPHEYLAQSENSLDLAPVATGSGGRAV